MNPIERVSVIGAGIMGKGIAQSIFKFGIRVKLFDVEPMIAEQAVSEIKAGARRNTDPEKITSVRTFEEAARDTDLVIEAVFEDIALKRRLFEELGKMAPGNVIFASNTSSLNISSMAAASGRQGKLLGLHFFNPALVMRLVEVVVPPSVEPETVAAAMDFLGRIKKTGIRCKESPGFVVNRILIPLVNEAFYLLDERSGNREDEIIRVANDIDSAIRNAGILLLGPFDLADLSGIDTIAHVADVIYSGFDGNPRYAPPPLYRKMIEKGKLGRKSGGGVYCYSNRKNDPDLNPCLDSNGGKVTRIPTPEFGITQFVAVMVNEAFRVLEEGIVSSISDIELSMELGTRWPKGPFRLAREYGVDKLCEELLRLHAKSNNSRYEPSTLFKSPTRVLREFLSAE